MTRLVNKLRMELSRGANAEQGPCEESR